MPPQSQTSQSMLVNREECETQVQPRSDQDRLMAASADPSYLNWQGVLHSPVQVPNHLCHQSGQSPSDTPESRDNGQPKWVPFIRDYQSILVFFLFSLVRYPLMPQEEAS